MPALSTTHLVIVPSYNPGRKVYDTVKAARQQRAAAVPLSWLGVMPVNISAPVKYFRPEEGGVTHFHYGRDNVLLTWMHMRLFAEFLVRLPALIARRRRSP